jgi:hypothetical protein
LFEWKGGGAENLWLKRCRRNERMGEKRERERTNAPSYYTSTSTE